ncbi:MAG: hypothetical protein K2G42_03715 [Clostridia bacterium]|nr:hypothetical protein [Clostridia bacterium]
MGLFKKKSTNKKAFTFDQLQVLRYIMDKKIYKKTITAKDWFAEDAARSQACSLFVSSLKKRMEVGNIYNDDPINFEWSDDFRYVALHFTFETCGKSISLYLGVTCDEENIPDKLNVQIDNANSIDIQLDRYPLYVDNANFIYENAAEKLEELLIQKGVINITF